MQDFSTLLIILVINLVLAIACVGLLGYILYQSRSKTPWKDKEGKLSGPRNPAKFLQHKETSYQPILTKLCHEMGYLWSLEDKRHLINITKTDTYCFTLKKQGVNPAAICRLIYQNEINETFKEAVELLTQIKERGERV